MSCGFETFREFLSRIGVAHPAYALVAETLEEVRAVVKMHIGGPVLLRGRTFDLPSKNVDHQLESVADAEHRYAEVEDVGMASRCARVVDAGRAAREHYALGFLHSNLVYPCAPREEFGVDLAFSNASGDEVGVLPTEVHYHDRIMQLERHREPPAEN